MIQVVYLVKWTKKNIIFFWKIRQCKLQFWQLFHGKNIAIGSKGFREIGAQGNDSMIQYFAPSLKDIFWLSVFILKYLTYKVSLLSADNIA